MIANAMTEATCVIIVEQKEIQTSKMAKKVQPIVRKDEEKNTPEKSNKEKTS